MGALRNALRCSSMKKEPATLKQLFDMDAKLHAISSSTLLLPSSETETDQLISMISYCTYVFTFTDPLESPLQHELKRHKLLYILSAVRSPKEGLLNNDRFLSSLVAMLAVNLFRSIPPPVNPCFPPDTLDEESPAIAFAPSWPHLHIVYDILAALVSSADAEVLQSQINQCFLSSLISLFHSEDLRERDRLKNVYHQMYSKLTSNRAFMRKSMKNVFLQFVCDTERHCGIGELLEIWGSIINGFTVPLKEEHKQFLVNVLLPLHKHKAMTAYHLQLSYCISQFLQKGAELTGVVVRGILRYWPVTNCHKELVLISEIEELVLSVELEQLDEVAVSLCTQIAKCLNSTNSQVCILSFYMIEVFDH
ncbi:Protein phosphatase 2A regulatory B subunit B56 protein [Dioscorea alata]|uniref:Protein phosphatase 2A regulatory B subunit B56 protein n=1 Tax=Dioscorea alata TaxID=55571 RepID=A0ACB7V623_DIOAL|nr:Protein phosphatase 2A regulatory B subunit B56 protein [Dioscorea alata]